MLECTHENYTKIKQFLHHDSDSPSDTTDWDQGGWADANPNNIEDRGCPWTRLKRRFVAAKERCTVAAQIWQDAIRRKRDEYTALAEQQMYEDSLSWPPFYNPYTGTFTRRYNRGPTQYSAEFWDGPSSSVPMDELRARR